MRNEKENQIQPSILVPVPQQMTQREQIFEYKEQNDLENEESDQFLSMVMDEAKSDTESENIKSNEELPQKPQSARSSDQDDTGEFHTAIQGLSRSNISYSFHQINQKSILDIQGLKDSKWENIHDILANIPERSKSEISNNNSHILENLDSSSSYIQEDLSDFAKSDIDLQMCINSFVESGQTWTETEIFDIGYHIQLIIQSYIQISNEI